MRKPHAIAVQNGALLGLARELHDGVDMTRPEEAQGMLEGLFLRRDAEGDCDAFAALGSMHSEQLYSTARSLSSSDDPALRRAAKSTKKT